MTVGPNQGVQVPFGPYTPDTPDYEKQGASEVTNVIPADGNYRPFPSFASISNALTARCQGAFFARKADGTGITFAGDATKLYTLSGTTWSDASRTSGGAYGTPTDGGWDFDQFGSSVLAFNGFDAPQVFNIDTDTNFSALGGSPPVSRYVCIAGDFVMTGNVSTARNRVQWSAINNSASWATSQTTQASQQDLPTGGWVQGLTPLEYGAIIYSEFAIRRAVYEGPPLIFRFSLITDSLGCSVPGSIANYRDLAFWCDRTGFYMIQGGAQITPIGEQRVNTTFWSNVDTGNLARVNAAIDPVNSLYCIFYPVLGGSGDPTAALIYNWAIDEWASLDSTAGTFDLVFGGATQSATTIEQLDALYGTLENVPYPLDSAFWAGVAVRQLAGFGTDHKFGYFGGANLQATVTTGEHNIIPEKMAFFRGCRPIVDGGSPTVQLGYRNRTIDAVTYGTAQTIDALGRCKFRTRARYFRGRMVVPAGAIWSHTQGLDDIEAMPAGDR